MKYKYIKIKIQKIVLFIPCFNALLFFVFYYNYFKLPGLTLSIMIKTIIIAVAVSAPIGFLGSLIPILFLKKVITLYIVPIVIGIIFIHVQNKVIDSQDDQNS